MNFFFNSALDKRSFLVKHDLNLHLLGTEWSILKVNQEGFVGIQEKRTNNRHGVLFPIYYSGGKISKDYFVYKKDSVSQRVSILKMRSKKILVRRKRPQFQNFRTDTGSQLIFMQTNFGILAIFIEKKKMNYIYITQHQIKSSGMIKGYEELDSSIDFRWLVLFGKNKLVLINTFIIFVTKIEFSNSIPRLVYINQMKPFDVVRGLAFSSNYIVLIGFQSIQLLQQRKISGKLRTAFVAKHGHKFVEEVLQSVVSKGKLYISNGFVVYSFSFRDKISQYSNDSEYY